MTVLADPPAQHRQAATVREEGSRAIRTRTHKYVHHVGDQWDMHELYHFGEDPDETHNLISVDSSLADDLRHQLADIIGEGRARRVGRQWRLPTDLCERPDGELHVGHVVEIHPALLGYCCACE